MKIEDKYTKEKNHWICKSCSCEIYSGKKKYSSICSCLSREEQVSLYTDYLSNFYTINGSEYQCNKCNQKITSAREKHSISCIGNGTRRYSKNLNSNLNPEYFSKYCDMGCGQESKFFHKNGKAYCCKFGAKCPVKVEKDREKKQGINPFENRGHPRGMKGKKAYNKGLTKETSEIVAKTGLAIKKSHLLYGDQRKKKHHTQESRDKIAKNMRDRYTS